MPALQFTEGGKDIMKRFTETTKWSDPWFRKLPPRLKCAWQFLCDQCDAAGVIDPDYEMMSFQVGEEVTGEDMKFFIGRVKNLPSGKLRIVKFLEFQYGRVDAKCPAHKPVIRQIQAHGLDCEVLNGEKTNTLPDRVMNRVSNTLQEEEEDKNKEENKETDKKDDELKERKDTGPALRVLAYLNERTNRKFRPTETNIALITARLAEDGVSEDGCREMIDRMAEKWLGDPTMDEFLRPLTLFGKQKFGGYYDMRTHLPEATTLPTPPPPDTQPYIPPRPENADLFFALMRGEQPQDEIQYIEQERD